MDTAKKGGKDVEFASAAFDPFAERQNEHPTTDGETFVHLLKASLGTGILAMPMAFKLTGLLMGTLAAILTGLICTHCSYILVKSAHILYRRTKQTKMTFPEVAECAFANGPECFRPLAKFSRYFVMSCLFITYFGSCAVYTVIIAGGIQQVIEFNFFWLDVRWYLCLLFVPLVLMSYIPNLKYLAPVSFAANVFMGIGLGITFYYLASRLPPITEREMATSITELPAFFPITIFAMEAIGVIMALENQMKTPQNFIGVFGVLNRGMTCVTIIYILLGFLGYWAFGSDTDSNITMALPTEEYLAQIVKISIVLGVFCTFSLQLYVCIEIMWNATKDRFAKNATTANYVMRTVIVLSAILVAIAVPNIKPLIGLVGALCFSTLGLLAPIAIEMVTCYQDGHYDFGVFNWILIKNIFCTLFGLIALVFGTKDAIFQIFQSP